MPSDERERQFERALQRHLREGPADAACPDVETLAAYHERTLSLEELAKWKEHIGGCLRCQETLALVEETNAITSHDWEQQNTTIGNAALGRAAKSASSHRVMSEELLEGAEKLARVSPMAAAPKQVIGRSSWKWMAPLGALAAGLLLFVAVRETKVSTPQSTVEVAQNREVAVPVENQKEPPKTPKSEEPIQPRRDNSALAEKTSIAPVPARPPVANSPAKNQDFGYTARANEEKLSAKDDLSTSDRIEAKPAPPQGVRAQDQLHTELDAARAKAAPSSIVSAPVGRAAGKIAAPEVSEAKKESEVETDKAKEAGAAKDAGLNLEVRPATESMQYARNSSILRKIAATDPRMILAPDGSHAWRLGTAGTIEATADSGKSWKLQTSGVLSELRAGSAPSENVCWIVGNVGTILLTIDGGRHWKQLTSPLREDLGGVHAVDARNASVWNVSNNKSFETTDGGVTWMPVANE